MNEERKTDRDRTDRDETVGRDSKPEGDRMTDRPSTERGRPMSGDSRSEMTRMDPGGGKPTSTADLAGRSGDGNGRGDTSPSRDTAREMTPLMPEGQVASHRDKWRDIQANFVDQPQDAVRDADSLVAEIIQTLTSSFADQRQGLEEKWSKGSEVSTEDLRRALQQYRSFFERLLAA